MEISEPIVHTYRSFIAELIKDYRADGHDTYVPNKYIYHKLVNYARTAIRQDSDSRRLYAQNHLFQSIHSFPLCPMNLETAGMGNYITDRIYTRSVHPVPDCYTTYTGYAMTVSTVQPADKTFVEIRHEDYKAIRSRKYRDRRIIYYWFDNRRLIFPDEDYKAVRLYGLFVNPIDVKKINGTFDPQKDKYLDQLFCCPDYLLSRVKLLTADDMKLYAAVEKDEVPDMNASNTKAPTAVISQ